MALKNSYKILIGVVLVGFIVGGVVYVQACDSVDLEGEWECTSAWTWDKDGESVPVSYVQNAVCVDGVVSSEAVLSIGAAQWSETLEGTCNASSEEIYGIRTVTKAVPRNDAAREFERERLGGRSLAPEGPQDFRAQLTSWSENQFKGRNHEGRIFTCERSQPKR